MIAPMRHVCSLIILGLITFSCHPPEKRNHEQSMIINMTIDSSLKLDPGLNTREYWIDFSKVKYFERPAINDFLKQRTNFIEISADSLIKNDSTWNQYGFLQNMLIYFENVQFKGDSMIINLSKIKASDGSNGIEIILKKEKGFYKVISSKIKWIS